MQIVTPRSIDHPCCGRTPRASIRTSGGCQSRGAWARHVLLENRIGPFHFAKQNVVAPEIGEVDEYAASVSLGEQATVANDVVQDEPPVAGEVDIDDFDIRVQPTHIILPCKFASNTSESALVVDCVDLDSLGKGR